MINKKIEESLGVAPADPIDTNAATPETLLPMELDQITNLDKIDAALPSVMGLTSSDREMDDLAETALDGYRTLMDLAMNVEMRFAGEILGAANGMLGHAITAKTKKIDKKLKMIDLQLKKLRLDRETGQDAPVATAEALVLDRNELLRRTIEQARNSANPDK